MFHGPGRLTFPDKSFYDGWFTDDKMDKRGEFEFPGVKKIRVKHKNGELRKNRATITYINDARKRSYKGEISDDFKEHGDGILINRDGSRHKCHFINGIEHGEGKLTTVNGFKLKAVW